MLLVARRIIAVLNSVAKNDTATDCDGNHAIGTRAQRPEQELHVIASAGGTLNTHRNGTTMANDSDGPLLNLSDEAVYEAHMNIDNQNAIDGGDDTANLLL